jgi:hypothetical protein
MSNKTAYPKRPQHFAHKFTRLLFRSCVGAQIGPDATLLLIAIVHCEDAKRYTGPVAFFSANLADQIGLSVSSMERARARAIEAGWLHCIPGAKRRAAQYWVTIPRSEVLKPDGSLDESEEILRQVDGVSGEHLTEEAGSIRGISDGASGEQANHLLTSSFPYPYPSSREAGESKPAEAKTKPVANEKQQPTPEPAVLPDDSPEVLAETKNPALLIFPTADGGAVDFCESHRLELAAVYPGVDVLAEAKKALLYAQNGGGVRSPSVMQFLLAWLNTGQQKGTLAKTPNTNSPPAKRHTSWRDVPPAPPMASMQRLIAAAAGQKAGAN